FGKINTGFVYVYENSAWRRGTELDITLSSSCVEKLLQQTIYSTSENSTDTTWYICVTNGNKQGNYVIPTSWRLATESEADTAQFGIPATTADSIKQGHINKAHYYVYEASKWRRGTDLDLLLEKICLASRKDSITKDDVGQYYTCTNEKKIQADGVTVYNTWRLSTANEADNYFTKAAVEGQVKQGDMDSTRIYVYENKAWRRGTSLDMQLSQEIDSEGNKINNGCIASKVGTVFKTAAKKYYTCTNDEIFENGVSIPTTWKLSTTSEADNYFVIDPQEGDARRGDMDTTLIYVYEGGKWRYGTELDLETELGACTKNKQGTVLNKYDNYQITSGWFKCVESSDTYINNTLVPYTWKPASKVEYDTYGFETPTKDSARKGNYTSTIYVYDIIAMEWRIGTSLDTNSSLGPCTESNLENMGRVYDSKNKYYLYYQCLANKTLNSATQPTSWQKSTYLKYDTWGLTCSKIGDKRKGRITTRTIYVCDSKIGPEWSELPSSITDTLGFGRCNKTFMRKRCTAGYGCKGSWLTRKGEALSELQSNIIKNNNDSCVIDIGGGDTINIFYGFYPEVNDGYVTKGSTNPNLKIIYDSLENRWSYINPYTQAKYADSLGSACTRKLYTETYAENIYGEITYPQGAIRTTEKGNKYVCALAQNNTDEEYSKYAWTIPSQVRLETYGLGCDLHNKRKLYLNKYVCEADTFRVTTKSETWAKNNSTERNSAEKNSIRCALEDEGKTVKVDEVGTTFICKNKLYVWDQKPVITRESVKIRNSSAYDYWTEDEVVGLGIKKWTTSNVLIDTILADVGIYQMDDRTEGIPSNFYVNKTIGSLICQSLGETKSMFRLPSKTEYQDLFTRFASDPKQLRAQSNGAPYPLIDWRPVGTNEFNFNLAPNGYLLADAEETTLPTTSLYRRTGTKESPIVTEVETMKIVGKDRAASFITSDGSVFVYDVVEGTSNKTTGYGAVRCVDTGSRATPPLSN
ncbi:MAG: hypothetical protein MJY98_11700, partial [Fibrobacter sp.]|nr:hypothetical protein [Fibrobacter sp.]